MDENIIYVFWTGDNEMSHIRKACFEQLKRVSQCNVKLINKSNLHDYIIDGEPLHEAYKYLSETHRADYLRTYFMNFYGGGYSDIKRTTGSWLKHFESLRGSDKWVNGYKEVCNGAASTVPHGSWQVLVGNGAYICKPQTPLTKEWYNEMISLLDTKLERLKQFPAKGPHDRAEWSKYPIRWTEMLGCIFHKVCLKYKDKLLRTLPISIFHGYR